MKNILNSQLWQLWNVSTFTDTASGEVVSDKQQLKAVCSGYFLTSKTMLEKNNVYVRSDAVTNTSDSALTFSVLRSRFVFDGGEYEVYTQYNGWQNESQGAWVPLVTEISARSHSVRTSSGAAPFVAIWNCQTERGYAFHLLPQSSWSVSVKRIFAPGENSYIGVELGIDSPNTALEITPGTVFNLPEIIYYEFKNKTDMDCSRLHHYCNRNMAERSLPVVYNTWLYKFARIDTASVARQISAAAELGAEYFVVDAGWFGSNKGWGTNIGDWKENMNSGFRGKMKKIADSVRAHGMKFGMWFEPERAVEGSDAVRNYGRYYIKNGDNYFIDFANPEAVEYIFNAISKVIDCYGAEFVKFDFNADLDFDMYASAFTKYFKGYRSFLKRVRSRYPDIYLSNCASGGMRMNLANCKNFQSFWLSDNQSPYHGMRIVKDSMLHLPFQAMERWAVIASNGTDIPSYDADCSEHIFSTDDGTWTRTRDVSLSYLKGFLTGAPIGFSCDVASLSDSVKKELKAHIMNFKKERSFWNNAACHILADSESVLVLQYSDPEYRKNVIHIFTNKIKQTGIFVYPILDKNRKYTVSFGGKCMCEDDLENGIQVSLSGNYEMYEMVITEAAKAKQ